MKTITGTFQKADGSAVASGKLYLQLSGDATAVTTAQIAPQRLIFPLDANGTLGAGVQVYGNDELTPATTYSLQVRDTQDVLVFGPEPVSITGTNPINLNLSVLASPGATPGVLLLTITSITVTGTTTLSGPIVATGTDSGVQTISGAKTFSGGVSTNTLNGIRFADQYAAGSVTGGLQEAHDSLPAGGGTIVLPPNYTATMTAAVNISKSGVCIIGSGMSSVISVNFAGNVFNVTGQNFCLKDVAASYVYTLTRAGSAFIVAGASVGLLQNIHISGNATTPTNGTFFSQVGTNGAWIFRDLFLFEGTITWDTFVTIQNNSGSVTAASYFFYNVVGGGKFLTAGILLDGALDTIQFTGGGLDGLTGTSGPTIWVRNTVGGFFDPRWVHFNGFSVEAPGQTAVVLDNVRDFQFFGYIASATTGVSVGAAAVGANIHNTVFVGIAQSAITVAAGAIHTDIHNNNFDDTANASNNTYDTISIAAATSQFTINNNTWRNVNGANKPRYGINVIAGVSNGYAIIGNIFTGATFGTGAINDGGTLTIKQVFGNATTTIANMSPSVIYLPSGTASAPGLGFVGDSTTGLYQLSSGNMEFTSAGTTAILYSTNLQRFGSGGIFGFASNTNPTLAVADVNVSRSAAGTLQIGTGETANANGALACAVVNAKQHQTTVTVLGTTGTVSLDASLGSVFTVTPTGAITLNATNCVNGQQVTVVVTTSGVSSFNITFGTNFKSTGILATGTTTGKVFTITFVCTGATANETARTIAM